MAPDNPPVDLEQWAAVPELGQALAGPARARFRLALPARWTVLPRRAAPGRLVVPARLKLVYLPVQRGPIQAPELWAAHRRSGMGCLQQAVSEPVMRAMMGVEQAARPRKKKVMGAQRGRVQPWARATLRQRAPKETRQTGARRKEVRVKEARQQGRRQRKARRKPAALGRPAT